MPLLPTLENFIRFSISSGNAANANERTVVKGRRSCDDARQAIFQVQHFRNVGPKAAAGSEGWRPSTLERRQDTAGKTPAHVPISQISLLQVFPRSPYSIRWLIFQEEAISAFSSTCHDFRSYPPLTQRALPTSTSPLSPYHRYSGQTTVKFHRDV